MRFFNTMKGVGYRWATSRVPLHWWCPTTKPTNMSKNDRQQWASLLRPAKYGGIKGHVEMRSRVPAAFFTSCAISWTRRGHRCQPSCFSLHVPSLFIAHRGQHSHRSSAVIFFCLLVLSASPKSIFFLQYKISASRHPARLEPMKLIVMGTQTTY